MPVSTPENTLAYLEKQLRNLWESGFCRSDALDMVGAPKNLRPLLSRTWSEWNRKYYGEPESAF